MGKMNEKWIPYSKSRISFGNRLRNRLWNRSRNRNWLRNRNRFRHLHKKRRLDLMMLRIDSRKESKFTCKRSILMEIIGLISLLKLLISIQELILISVLIPFLESFLIPLPEQIAIPRSIRIPIPISTPESARERHGKQVEETSVLGYLFRYLPMENPFIR